MPHQEEHSHSHSHSHEHEDERKEEIIEKRISSASRNLSKRVSNNKIVKFSQDKEQHHRNRNYNESS